jgi:hypothetical protein
VEEPEPEGDQPPEGEEEAAEEQEAAEPEATPRDRSGGSTDRRPSRAQPVEEDDWATAGEEETEEVAIAEPQVTAADLERMRPDARRGSLATDDIGLLKDVRPGTDPWRPAQALLLAHYEAKGDVGGHCLVAKSAIAERAGSADPQLNLEAGKCHLRQGNYNAALKTARVADLNAQDIPSKVRSDRQLKIWEIQANSYKGLYQASDELDYLDDAVVIWRRYRQLADKVYRPRDVERADTEMARLQTLIEGAL